jgi:hypothetical protein
MTQTITPERQQAAAQIGQVFNSMQQYLTTLMQTNEAGERLTSQPMEYARKGVEEASFWAIKHVLMHGVPAAPKQPEAPPADPTPPAANDEPLPAAGPESPDYGKFE